MEADKWLRPDVWRLVRLIAVVLACAWLSLAGLTAYVSVWWLGHGILDNTPAEWFGGAALLSLVFTWPFALSWLWDRRVAWRVGAEGIAVYRGGALRRSFAWSEVVSLRVLPYVVIARLAASPFEERLPWLTAAESAWLREFARGPLGERVWS